MKKVGINGIAGRIGKFAAYELVQLEEGIIVAVNDLAKTDEIVASLGKKDSVHGNLGWNVTKVKDELIEINGNPVRVYHSADPAKIAWGSDVCTVAECTGRFSERSLSMAHFALNEGSLDTVIISAPGKGTEMLVMGINHEKYKKGDPTYKVISNASCTTKAVAMPLYALVQAGVYFHSVMLDTVHAATNTQKPLEFNAEYGVLDNILAASTGAAKATGEVIPELKGKVTGVAYRVPTRDGSVANIYCLVEGPNVNLEGINNILREAAIDPRYQSRMAIHLGSGFGTPDIQGRTDSAIVAIDMTESTVCCPGSRNPANQLAHVKIVSGYDNERGPAKDLALLTQYVMKK